MEPLNFLSFTKISSSSRSFLSLFVFSLQLLCLSSQPSFSFVAHSNASSTSCPHHQKAALLRLKNGFSIQRGTYHNSSSRLDSWSQATDCCSWEGITCDVATGLVIDLDLSSSYDMRISWIEGRIDSSLFHLWSLQKLDLSWNGFYPNPIPSGLGQLTYLIHLNFSYCGFVGQIPLEISQLTKLVSLDLSYNNGLEIKNPNLATLFGNFSNLEELFLGDVNISEHGGELARALSSAITNLRRLSLSYCDLDGQIPIEISQLTKLVSLDLSGNSGLEIKNKKLATLFGNFSNLEELFLDDVDISKHGGELARALSSAVTNLRRLSLSYCDLDGQIPMAISQLTKLVSLDLSGNSGIEIKISNVVALFGNLSSLEELFLDYVNISDHGGKWAHALTFALPNIRILSLRYCGLSGPNNFSLFDVPFLFQLSLDGNNISSNAVLNWSNNFPSLTSLTLINCGFWGKFLESVFLLPNLQILDISENYLLNLREFPMNNALRLLRMDRTNFQEKLPNSFGNLKFLEELSLSNCNLSGFLPSSIANLTHLELLDLSSNNFKGRIPSHFFSHPSLYSLYLSYNTFDGMLDDIQNASSSLKVILLNGNNFQGPIPSIIYNQVEIQVLDLSYNNFSGTVEWPNMFQSFKNIKSLDLSFNNFNGTVELLDVFQSFRNLQFLSLSGNNLSVINSMAGSNLISLPPIQYLRLSSCNICEFPNILRNLKQLRLLDLSNNKIHGEIPSWIWKVGNETLFYLNLSHNFLESIEHPMPDLSSFSQLDYIDLHSNGLQGSISTITPNVRFQDYSKNNFSSIVPRETNLTFVYFFSLSENNISGEIPLSVCNARNLQVLDLSSNNFSGKIPTCIGEISDSLEILSLKKNSFYGMLPQSFKNACTLRTLNVQQNHLEGPLPKSLANCKYMEVLDLGNNQINDTFPSWFKDLSHLRILILRSNKFHGPIAHSQMNFPLFPLLQIFDISSNYFIGSFPSNLFLNWKAMMGDTSHLGKDDQIVRHQLKYIGTYYQDSVTLTMKWLEIEVVKILTALISVDVSNNRFDGTIEESIGTLKLLYVLNFSQNDFSGPIPQSLGKLTQLESLDLSRNKLIGEIPRQLLELTFLAVLNLSQNLLIGSIPRGQQFLTFANDSFLGNRGLCGPPLSKICEDTGASSPPDFESFGSNKVGEIDWRMMWIGFGVGFGVGLGVVFWTLALWRKGSRKCMQLIDGVVLSFFW